MSEEKKEQNSVDQFSDFELPAEQQNSVLGGAGTLTTNGGNNRKAVKKQEVTVKADNSLRN